MKDVSGGKFNGEGGLLEQLKICSMKGKGLRFEFVRMFEKDPFLKFLALIAKVPENAAYRAFPAISYRTEARPPSKLGNMIVCKCPPFSMKRRRSLNP